MTRKWRPGDVAMVECSDGEWRQATCEPQLSFASPDVLKWRFSDRAMRYVDGSRARPALVIDPESREQAARLDDLIGKHLDESPKSWSRQQVMQAVVREFANPRPPRIKEPGIWGVVTAACVHDDHRGKWVRFADGNWYRTAPESAELVFNGDDWESLVDPDLVRDGVGS